MKRIAVNFAMVALLSAFAVPSFAQDQKEKVKEESKEEVGN